MRKLIFLIFAISVIPSCKEDKSNSIEYKLRGNTYKHWLYIKTYPPHEKSFADSPEEALFICYFDKYGKYLDIYNYGLNKEVKDTRDHEVFTDVEYTNRWSLKEDSILKINEMDYIIEQLDADLMVLKNPRTGKRDLYIVAPNGLLTDKYHRLQE